MRRRSRVWGRRGDTKELLPELFVGMIIVVFITLFLLFVVKKFLDSPRFEAKYVAKDLALMTDTLHASPNDISVMYPHKVYMFSYRFTDNGQVSVFDGDEYSLSSLLALEYFMPSHSIRVANRTLTPTVSDVKSDALTYMFSSDSMKAYIPLRMEKRGQVIEASEAISLFDNEG
jgi:hypothetical protein